MSSHGAARAKDRPRRRPRAHRPAGPCHLASSWRWLHRVAVHPAAGRAHRR